MPNYNVTIKATVIKTILIEDVEDKDEAIEEAYTLFHAAPDIDGQEKYNEEWLHCNLVEG